MSLVTISNLPADPTAQSATSLAAACKSVYEMRGHLIGSLTVDQASEALRRCQAIERYVRGREYRNEAQRSQRVLEMAVGAALGEAPTASERGALGGRGKKALAREQEVSISDTSASRFRLMASRRDTVEACLAAGIYSRRQVLDRIERESGASSYEVGREFCTVDDLAALAGNSYGTIYADPAWQYGNQGTRGATGGHYAGMTVEEICALPVAQLAAEKAHLHLWTTNAFLFDARLVLEAWGFAYKSCYVWVKPQIGMGNYWRVAHEFLLLGVRGEGMSFPDKTLRSWGQFPRGKHSAKPEHIRDLIHRVSPGPRLELFARRPVEGWTCWGNEIERNMFHDEASNAA